MAQAVKKQVKVRRLYDEEDRVVLPDTGGAAALDLDREMQAQSYSQAEQKFSVFLERQLLRLLRGDADDLLLLRRYPSDRHEVGLFLPKDLARTEIRADIGQRLVQQVLDFLNPMAPGGPVAQATRKDRLVQTRLFPTRYAHILLERSDVFRSGGEHLYSQIRAVRLETEKPSTILNRALDVGALALELVKFL